MKLSDLEEYEIEEESEPIKLSDLEDFEEVSEDPVETGEEARLAAAGEGIGELIEALPEEVKAPVGGAIAGQAIKSGVEALPSEALRAGAEEFAYSAVGGTGPGAGRKFIKEQMQQLGDLPEGAITTRSLGRRALDEGLIGIRQGTGEAFEKAESGLLESIKEKMGRLEGLKKPVPTEEVSKRMRQELLGKVDLTLGGKEDEQLLKGLLEEEARMKGKARLPSDLEKAKVKTQESVAFKPGIEPLGRSEQKLKLAKARALREAVEEAVGKEGGEEALQQFLEGKRTIGERGILRNLLLEKEFRETVSPTIGFRDIATTGVGGPGFTAADRLITKKGAAIGAKTLDSAAEIAEKFKRSGLIRSLPVIGAVVGLAASFGEARAEGLDYGESAGRALEEEGTAAVLGGFAPERIAEDKREELMIKRARGEQLTPEEREMLKPFRQEPTSPVVQSKQRVTQLSDEEFANFAQKLTESPNEGLKVVGARLMEAGAAEGPAKQQMLWSLSQSPAMRELIRRQVGAQNSPEERSEYVTRPDTLPEEAEALEGDLEAREPASVESIEEGLDFIISDQIEGGFQAQSEDRGNYLDGELIGTNHGITPQAYQDYFGEKPSQEDMQNLTKEQAKEIYRQNYIEEPGFDQINDPNLQTALVDFGINSGPQTAIKHLQRIIGADADGIIGPETLAKIEQYEGDLRADLMEARGEFIRGLNNPTYEKGWLNRLEQISELTAPENTVSAPGELESVDRVIDSVNKMQGSGDNTPVDQIEQLLEKINKLRLPQESVDELENDAVNMASFSQGQELKEKIRKLMGQ